MALDITSYEIGKKAGGGGGSNYQSKSVEITENGTTNITPDTGYDALSNVNVTVNGILDTSDADAVASDMATGKTAYVNGNKITGNVPVGSSSVATNYGATNVDIYLDDLQVDTQQGNTNQMFRTGDKISVYTPLTDVAQVVGASAEKIKKDEVICGITGTYEGGGDDWSDIGYSSTPDAIDDIHAYSKAVYDVYPKTGTAKRRNIQYYKNDAQTKLVICPLIATQNLYDDYYSSFFDGYTSLVEVPAIGIVPGSSASLENFFNGCTNLTKVDLSNFNTGNARGMSRMFQNCSSLTSLDLSNFSTAGVQNSGTRSGIYKMFYNCNKLSSITFGSNFTCQNIQNLNGMFAFCSSLTNLDLSYWNTSSATILQEFFYSCSNLETITFGSNFTFTNATNLNNMFYNCNKLDDNTLNQILYLCTTATAYTGTKNLSILGITNNTLLAKIPNLSNYQDFLDAGWTIS